MNNFKDDPTQTPSARRAVRAVTSPTPGSRRRSLSVGAETRQTPSRALYEDLPTAYSSITSRVANHHKGRFLTSSPDLTPNKLWTQPSPLTDASQIQRESFNTGTLHRKRQLGTIDPFTPPIVLPNPSNEFSKNDAITTPPNVQSNLHTARGRIGKSRTPKKWARDKFQGPAVNRMVMRNQKPFFIEDGCLASSRALTHLKFRSLTEERRMFWELCVQNNFMMMGEARFPAATKTRAKGIPLFKRRGLEALKPLIVPQLDDRVDTLHGTVVSQPHFSRPIVSNRHPNEYGGSQDAILKQQSAPHMLLDAGSGSDHLPSYLQNNATKVSRSQTEDAVPLGLPIHPTSFATINMVPSRKDSVPSDGIGADDFGPGSSQASSSVHLSQYAGSSLALRSHRQRPSIVSLSSGGNTGANAFFQAKLRTNQSIDQMKPASIGNYTTHINRPSLYISNTEEHDCDDWETVAGSQQFTGASGNRLAHMESGSSLADYSSFGSLATRTLGSRSSLYHSRKRFSMGCSHSVRNNRLSQGRRAYAHSPSRIPARNSSVQHPAGGSSMKRASRYGSLGDVVPALKASTSKHPAPRLGSSPPYHHPTPLDNSHPNPFQSTPPAISEKKRRVLQKSDKSGGSDTGLISSIRNSKLQFSNNNHNTSTLHSEDGGSKQQRMANSLKAREESSAWGTISSLNTSRPHSPSYPIVIPAHHIEDKSSRFSNSQPQYNNNKTLNTPTIAPGTDPGNSNDSLHLTTSHVHTRPHSRFSINESLKAYHRRDNSSILAPSCANSSENLIPRTSSVKYPPGSLYLSIRSARDRVLKPRTRQTSVDNSVSSKRETLLSPHDSIRPTSKISRQEGKNGRESRISRSLLATPSALNTPMRTYSSRSTFRNDRDRPKKPDEILRERLSRIETTPISGHYCQPSLSEIGYTSRSCTSPLPERPSSTWNPNSTLSRQYTVRRGTASPFASIDEESAPAAIPAPTPTPMPTWYESTNSRHAFSEPPRLVSNSNLRHPHLSTPREMGNLITQRRLGQQLILIFSLAAPLGWFLVFFIGFGGDFANFLMRWRSWGYVAEFHEKERAVARRMGVVYAVFTFVFALVLLVVLLLVR